MPETKSATREKILAAAEAVFHENGFKGARTTQIAERSGVSRTMMHYYFRTKEELFQEVLKNTFGFFLEHAQSLFVEHRDLKTLIDNLVDLFHKVLSEKPGLPSFLVNIINENPALIINLPVAQTEILPALFDQLLAKAREDGSIQSHISGENLVLNLYGMMVMPYLGAPFIQYKEGRSSEDMQDFLRARKETIKSFLWNGLQLA
ncbi:MAG: TetR/AcrR family transcriptional regulator [Bacteroidota bacterium]